MPIRPIRPESSAVIILDQCRLPGETVELSITTPGAMAEAIRRLAVRGAPAIGIAAAYGVWLGVAGRAFASRAGFLAAVDEAAGVLTAARPTAVNLFWAASRMQQAAHALPWQGAEAAAAHLRREADAILAEDEAGCRSIGQYGADVLRGLAGVLTHCNAGGLATSGYGTALAPIYLLHEEGRAPHVYADETRPLLQGARLTAWELQRAGVGVTLLCDSMAPLLLRDGRVQAVIVGADRIAANGDAANKVGSYGLSVQAKVHGVPFYIAAPFSTVDFACPSGSGIPIEERDAGEVRGFGGALTAPAEVEVYNPAFDVVPAGNITAIITELGVVRPPFGPGLAGAAAEGALHGG